MPWSQDAEKSSWNWDGSLLPTFQLCLQLSTARQAADPSATRLTGQETASWCSDAMSVIGEPVLCL